MSRSVVPKGPWIDPLDWNLHATSYGESYVPFALHIYPAPTYQSSSTFSLFLELPTALQLHILRFCDHATLFWLMPVCSAIRSEAQKLFWSNPHVWYCVRASWVLSGGFTGHTHYDVESLRRIKQVEVDFGVLRPLRKHVWIDGVITLCPGFTEEDREQRIQAFWQVLQQRFPCVSHVVLSESSALLADDPMPEGPKRIAEECPESIRTYVSYLQQEAGYERRLRRRLLRHDSSKSTTTAIWEVVTPVWTRQSVLPPLMAFRGPVGAYSYWEHQNDRCNHLGLARRLLLIHAVGRYYQQNQYCSFICPATSCDLRFKQPADWAAHAIDAWHNEDIVLPSEQLRYLFTQHDVRLVELRQKAVESLASMRIAWGENDSQERREAKHTFLHQLQHDPLYTCKVPPIESSIWEYYVGDMNNEPRFC